MDWNELWRLDISNSLQLFRNVPLIFLKSSIQQLQYLPPDLLMILLEFLMYVFLSILHISLHLSLLISKFILDPHQK